MELMVERSKEMIMIGRRGVKGEMVDSRMVEVGD